MNNKNSYQYAKYRKELMFLNNNVLPLEGFSSVCESVEHSRLIVLKNYIQNKDVDLEILKTPEFKYAIWMYYKNKAKYEHKYLWKPKLSLPLLSSQQLYFLKNNLDKLHTEEDINTRLSCVITGFDNIKPTLMDFLLTNSLQNVIKTERINIESSDSKPKYRPGNTCIGLWYKSYNHYLWLSFEILRLRHEHFFYLNKCSILNSLKNKKTMDEHYRYYY